MPSMHVTLAFVLMFSAELLGATALQLIRVTRSLVGLEASAQTLRSRMAVVRLFSDQSGPSAGVASAPA